MWARRYAPLLPNWTVDELVDMAVDRLRSGAESWDPAGGATFASWCSMGVRARFQREVERLYTARLAKVMILVAEARHDLESDLGRPVSVEEVAGACGLCADRVASVENQVAEIRAAARTRSLDAPLVDDTGSLYDVVSAATAPSGNSSGSSSFGSTLTGLSPRHRRLVRHVLDRGDTPLDACLVALAASLGLPVDEVVAELHVVAEELASG
jgi:DNA-directed RNA polymerase sigma subunit (sigma70/sigma32)